MKYFTIENETNDIMVHASAEEAEAVANAERFRNEGGLAKLATEWPMARLVEIYNGLPESESLCSSKFGVEFRQFHPAQQRLLANVHCFGGFLDAAVR